MISDFIRMRKVQQNQKSKPSQKEQRLKTECINALLLNMAFAKCGIEGNLKNILEGHQAKLKICNA